MGNCFSKRQNKERPPNNSGRSPYPEHTHVGQAGVPVQQTQQLQTQQQQLYRQGANMSNLHNHAAMELCEMNVGRQMQRDYSALMPQSAAASPPPPSAPTPAKVVRVHALYNYTAQNPDDLDFKKGDVMIVESGLSESWWVARHLGTGQQGYIPSNYVVVEDGRPTSLDAWFDISRSEADRLLLMPGLPQGTYILRPSSQPRILALSIRYEPEKNMFVTKHYKVHCREDNCGYFITNRLTCPTIQDLIAHYENSVDGLCCRLTQPCPRTYTPPVQFRDLEVNRKSIQLVRKLGHGSFGEVHLAVRNKNYQVAVKVLLNNVSGQNAMDRNKFLDEAKVMHKLRHPRIVTLLGVCTEPPEEPVFIIVEYMQKGALSDFLHRPEGQKLQFADLIGIISQVAEGMAYLEKINTVHRDLRAANILVAEDNSVKVADFGLAKMLSSEKQIDAATKFPIKWTAPEATMSEHRFSTKSDVWSFGILIYEIITYGCPPYHGMNNRQVMQEVERGYRMPNPHTPQHPCPNTLYEIMLSCWNVVPEKRPTFSHLFATFDSWEVQIEGQYIDNAI
ncbi:hypothetical protein AAHC03_026988 [Spirometra sp. Aus1]